MTQRLPKLPALLDRKLYKTGQTRGASTQEIYQNRVSRNSTVLIPWEYWSVCKSPNDGSTGYENGFIVLVNPDWYFSTPDSDAELNAEGVELGNNAVLFFNQRQQYERSPVKFGEKLSNGQLLSEPNSRISPIGGNVLARMHGTTAKGSGRIDLGFNETSLRGAGIRVYEYASSSTIISARLQLEAYFWLTEDAIEVVVEAGMELQKAETRKTVQLEKAKKAGLLDWDKLRSLRIVDENSIPICPLCLERISASDFLQRGQQAEGRETWDITITEISLFHIDELRLGKLQHKPYNLGWGHHFCNVVAKDAGLEATINWMAEVVDRNRAASSQGQSNSVPTSISELSV